MPSATADGATPLAITASLAGHVTVSSASAHRAALTIWRAARSASIVSSGSESETVNQANSSRGLPLNHPWNGDPVRIRPGQTVVTMTLSFASSARMALDSPVSANLLAQY